MTRKNNILKINDKHGNLFYGGDQDWYSSNSRAMAGCSSVAGANALRALCRTRHNCFDIIKASSKMPGEIKRALISSNCNKDDFLMLMTGIYEVMKSFEIFPLNKIYDRKERGNKFFHVVQPNRGRSSIGFIQGVLLFAAKIGLNLKFQAVPTAFMQKQKALDFIEKGLRESGSVVLLTSYNKHSIKAYPSSMTDKVISCITPQCYCQNTSMKCHFATITGITDDKLIITTWGKVATVDIDELVNSWQSIKAWESTLFYFSKAGGRAEMLKYLLSSPVPFFKGIVQALIRKHI